MQAYATAERLSPDVRLPSLDSEPRARGQILQLGAASDLAMLDGLLGRLADLVVDRLMERTADGGEAAEEWLDARGAAEYLGLHRDTLRKLAAERAVPVHQDAPGCRLYFRRDELDGWRRSSKRLRTRLRAVS